MAFALGLGRFVTLFPAFMAQISPQDEIGTRIGLAQLANEVGAFTGAPLGSALISQRGDKIRFLDLEVSCDGVMIASVIALGRHGST